MEEDPVAEKQLFQAGLASGTKQSVISVFVCKPQLPHPSGEISVPKTPQIGESVISAHRGKSSDRDALSSAIAQYCLPDPESAAVVNALFFLEHLVHQHVPGRREAAAGVRKALCFSMESQQFVVFPDKFHGIDHVLFVVIGGCPPKGGSPKMLEHVPAAVREFHSVAALGTAVCQDIDCTVPAGSLCAEVISGKSLALISVRSPYDHFDILHGCSSFLRRTNAACRPDRRILSCCSQITSSPYPALRARAGRLLSVRVFRQDHRRRVSQGS